MAITFTPELSFYGTLHWRMPDGLPAIHGLSATFIELAPTSTDNGWIYCSVGDTYSGPKRIALGLSEVSGRLVGLKFWFACYVDDSAPGLSRYRYDLCVYEEPVRGNPFQFHTLDVSRNGYLGLYPSRIPDEQGLARNAPLWELAGLDPLKLAAGAEVADLALVSPTGQRARRLMEDGFPYLNVHDGHDALFTLKVAENGMQRPW